MTTANDAVSCHAKYKRRIGRALFTACIGAFAFSLTACDPDCGIRGDPISCTNTFKNKHPVWLIKVTLNSPQTEYGPLDSVPVRVTAINISDRTVTIPRQVCTRPFEVLKGGRPMADGGYICDGDSYGGGTLAAGDSISWLGDMRSEIAHRPKELEPGAYQLIGHVSVKEVALSSDTVDVWIMRK